MTMTPPRPQHDSDLPDADTLPCMLVWLSADGAVLRTNRAFAEFSGISHSAGATLALPSVLSDDSAAALATHLAQHHDFELNLRLARSRSAAWADAWLDCRARWLPDQGGYLCVQSPVHRTALLDSGGNVGPNDCSGAYTFDFNAWMASGEDPALVAGTMVYAQFWSRDSGASFNTIRSDGLRFGIAP